jgi:hypothetical protein
LWSSSFFWEVSEENFDEGGIGKGVSTRVVGQSAKARQPAKQGFGNLRIITDLKYSFTIKFQSRMVVLRLCKEA